MHEKYKQIYKYVNKYKFCNLCSQTTKVKAFSSTHFFHTFQPSIDKNVVQLATMPRRCPLLICVLFVVSPGSNTIVGYEQGRICESLSLLRLPGRRRRETFTKISVPLFCIVHSILWIIESNSLLDWPTYLTFFPQDTK